MSSPLLNVQNLEVRYGPGGNRAVDGVSFSIAPGEIVALVGESGSGKSTIARAIMGTLPSTASVASGTLAFEGRDLLGLDAAEARRLRGVRIGFVPQDPTAALDPSWRIGPQVAEGPLVHGLVPARQANERAAEALSEAGLPEARDRFRAWPHELSGGQRQRVLIASAFVTGPALIIADEPTSALDVTVQRRILDHLERLAREHHTAMLLVTHDLPLAAERADRVIVLRDGRIVEEGTAKAVLGNPRHAYTRTLIEAIPATAAARTSKARVDGETALVEVRDLQKSFRNSCTVVDNVRFDIRRGETLALVGDSGSGKTTTARMVLALAEPTSGSVRFDGIELTTASRDKLRQLRQRMQLVYQNPFSSFDPRIPIGRAIVEPLAIFGMGDSRARQHRSLELLDQVALPSSVASRRPRELSGGQLQRAAIARAIALRPDLLVLDEPVSALDVSTQAHILRLLATLQEELNLAYLFITHDLRVVSALAHRVAVMSGGRIHEIGDVAEVFSAPSSPVARELLAAVPGILAKPE